MKKIIFLILAGGIFLFPQEEFRVEFDYAAFHYNDSLGYVEIYYSYYQKHFQPVASEDNSLKIDGTLNVLIKNAETNAEIINKEYEFSSPVDTSVAGRIKGYTGLLNFLLPFGDYVCTLKGRDKNSVIGNDSSTLNITVKIPPDDRFSISDIQLGTSIKEAETSSGMFYKNTYEVIPNPANVYGNTMPVVYFYSEIYNIGVNATSEYLKVEYILYNSSNRIFYKKTKYLPRTTSSVAEVGAINITKAPSGAYMLVLAVTDSIKSLTIYSSKRLFVYNPGVVDTITTTAGDMNILSSEFASMSEEELNEMFAVTTYIADTKEEEQWNKLESEDAKRKFLIEFWKKKDQSNSTPENEYKKEYFKRVAIANERYTTIQKKGWKTDRGRIFVTYGEPSEIERYPNQVDTKPYEIWNYNDLEGGVMFVFADLYGFNDYQLLNSNMRGELRDDYWMRKVRTY